MAISIRASLHLKLFGNFEARLGDVPVSGFRSQKARWVLALLALQSGNEVDYEWLAQALWLDGVDQPDLLEQERAIVNVRQCLTNLNRILDPNRLAKSGRSCIRLERSDLSVDVFDFDAAIQREDLTSLREAVKLYDGELLAGCAGTWVERERELRRRSYQQALQTLIENALSYGAHEDAEHYLRLHIALDGMKTTHRCELMRLLESRGEYQAAIQVYTDWRTRITNPKAVGGQIETQYLALQARLAGMPAVSPLPNACRVPYPIGTLIGRDRAIEEIRARLTVSRLVTLKGPPGVGKTQLALHVAADLQTYFTHGSVFVDLTDVADAKQIAVRIATQLQLPDLHQGGHEEKLQTFLYPRSLLLILDNCERLVPEGAAIVGALLRRCPHLRILATGRRVWSGITGSRIYTVQPLTTPGSDLLLRSPDEMLEAMSRFPAIQLFLDRVRDMQPDFDLDAQNASIVIRICRQLDGLPLALELAAGWTQTLSPQQMLTHLDRGPLVLITSTPAKKYRILSGAVEASYTLLSPLMQRCLLQLGVFRGGWPLEAAQAVCGVSDMAQILTDLQERSLVLSETSADSLRFRMLETIRQFVGERAVSTSESAQARDRHLDHFLTFAEAMEPEMTGSNQTTCLDRLEREHDNFRAALEHAQAVLAGERGLRLVGALWRFWYARGYYQEGSQWIERMLALAPDVSAPVRIRAYGGAGNLAYRMADYDAAQTHFEARLELEKASGNIRGVASATGSLANVASSLGNRIKARILFERSLSLFREAQDLRGISLTLGNLAVIACAEGDYAQAGRYHEESIFLFRNSGDEQNLALALNNLADTKLALGVFEEAEELLRESLALGQSLKIKHSLLQSLALCFCLLTRRGQWESASVISGAEEALRERLGLTQPLPAATANLRLRQAILEGIGPAAYEVALAHGRVLTEAEAIAFVFLAFEPGF